MVVNAETRLSVLLVEDFSDTRDMIKRALEQGDFRVIEAANGFDAVEAVRRECPDLILMDLNLPLMDGLTAVRQIREIGDACEQVPIIAITAYDAYGMHEAALEAGCTAYLTKPIELKVLDRIIRQALLGW